MYSPGGRNQTGWSHMVRLNAKGDQSREQKETSGNEAQPETKLGRIEWQKSHVHCKIEFRRRAYLLPSYYYNHSGAFI